MSNPTPAELEILRIIWPLSEAKVQTVNDELNKIKPVGYTTTLKTMQIMEQKGLLERRRDGKSHIYSPTLKKEETQTSLLDRLIATVFAGSQSKLIMQLLKSDKMSPQELEDIKSFLAKMEKKND